MAPAWEQLASDYEKSPTTLIAQVDCTDEEDLCSEFDVEGFPTLLYGDVSDMNVYEGDHDYESLKEFAEENLTTEICSIHYEGACSKAEKDAIAELRKKTLQELLEIMKQFETEAEEAESLYQAEVERLEELYRNAVNALSEKFETLKKEKHYAHVLALLAKMKADKEEL
jgi:Thioredoxin